MKSRNIEITGARTHNLKNVSVEIPLGRLTVITGPSGSGKSSLAFDTLYAEGQRRFVESMSTYARQFIEKMERPDVDQIRNIQPAIAIEQKNRVKNARSTIGTATEISDYLRLLYAKAGVTICPECKLEVREDSPQSVTDALLAQFAGARLYVLGPVARSSGVGNEALRTELLRAGFTRIYAGIDTGKKEDPVSTAGKKVRSVKASVSKAGKTARGTTASMVAEASVQMKNPERTASPILSLEDASSPALERALSHAVVYVVVDRLVADENDRDRLTSAVSTAFQVGGGTCQILPADAAGPTPKANVPARLVFHSGFRCNGCGKDFPRPEPHLFSFNSPIGACPKCSGFGRVTGVDWEKVLPNLTMAMNEEPVAPFNSPSYRSNYKWLQKTMREARIPFDVPLEELDPEQLETIRFGSGKLDGIQSFFNWLDEEKYKMQSRIMTARYRGYTTCPDCRGTRLVPAALNVFWKPRHPGNGNDNGNGDDWKRERHIGQVLGMSIKDLLRELEAAKLDAHEEELFGRVHREILSRLQYLSRVGLGYLTLDRQTRTLSGGEAQRINLATALGTALTQTLYVLDEPTVGLHPRDSRRLLGILRDLRDKGNTLVVVEHDTELILGADHLLDVGPAAGSGGGQIIFEGTPQNLIAHAKDSLTAKFLRADAPGKSTAEKSTNGRGKKSATKTTGTREAIMPLPSGTPRIRIHKAREHNLKGISVDIPLGKWVCVTGVSGSGKTTLIHNILYQAFNKHAKRPVEDMGRFESIAGLDQLLDVMLVDQSGIGKSIRSNPVTYVKAYDPIRKLMASTREARTLGITESAFSFNVAGGRCEACEGTGVTTYDMHFLAEVTLPCETCDGKRFSPRVLEVRYKDKNIDDILGMTVDDATVFFADQPPAIRRLAPLREVGLGYVTLGQNTSTLSGGEAQRLKLATHLSGSQSAGIGTMMIFDEPTTGLHLADLDVLSRVFRRLVHQGYSLVIIEHNLEIIRQADWIIDLGPEAGDGGGELIATGPPDAVAAASESTGSHTGRFLASSM